MSRHLRFIPDGGALVEVTCRTVQGRLLLCPSPQLNDIILGVLGRAQRKFPVEIVAYVFASNHFHGVKEGLVGRVEDWPGIHCAVPLMTGAPVEGTWFDRTREHNARLRGKELEGGSESREAVWLSPLPCWRNLGEEEYRGRIREIVEEINQAAAVAREESQIPPLGADGVRAQSPETRPRKIKKSPAPFCHALRKKVRKALWEAYGVFLATFREAAESWRAGDRSAAFPVGSFPPGLPFVMA